jgi:hypothetical protein
MINAIVVCWGKCSSAIPRVCIIINDTWWAVVILAIGLFAKSTRRCLIMWGSRVVIVRVIVGRNVFITPFYRATEWIIRERLWHPCIVRLCRCCHGILCPPPTFAFPFSQAKTSHKTLSGWLAIRGKIPYVRFL